MTLIRSLVKKTHCIPPKFEGFVLILFNNCYENWKFIAEEKMTHGARHKCDPKDDRMKTLYTMANGGQQQWGGWTKEGRDLAKEYAEENKEARKTVWSKNAEKLILQRIRIKNKLEGPEASLTKKRRRKRSQDDEDESDGDDLLINQVDEDSEEEESGSDDSEDDEDEGNKKPAAKKSRKDDEESD